MKTTNDGKDKHHSWEACEEKSGSASDGCWSVSMTAYGSTEDEAKANLREVAQIAALALAGTAFGFTWADVDAIQTVASEYEGEADLRARAFAGRIAALLPPREG